MVVGPDPHAHSEHESLLHEYVHYLLRTRRGLNIPPWFEPSKTTNPDGCQAGFTTTCSRLPKGPPPPGRLTCVDFLATSPANPATTTPASYVSRSTINRSVSSPR